MMMMMRRNQIEIAREKHRMAINTQDNQWGGYRSSLFRFDRFVVIFHDCYVKSCCCKSVVEMQ